MKWAIWGIILTFLLHNHCFSQEWELSEDDLQQLIKKSDVIVEGQLIQASQEFLIEASEVIKGSQQISKLSISDPKAFSDILPKQLFQLNLDDQKDLNSKNISQSIRDSFAKYQKIYSLSSRAKIKIIEKNDAWEINDRDRQQRYYIKKQKQALSVYAIDTTYIFFLTQKQDKYTIATAKDMVKSDVLVKTRIRQKMMDWRVSQADVVVSAQVEKATETPKETGALGVYAICNEVKTFKGSIAKQFVISYDRDPKTFPPQIFLFDGLTYVFFLKNKGDDTYEFIDIYDSALPDRFFIIKEIKAATVIGMDLAQQSGKEINGIRAFGRAMKGLFTKDEPIILNFLLQNVSQADIDLYHNHKYMQNFISFSVIDNDKNEFVSVKSPDTSETPKLDKRYFLKLTPARLFTLPPMKLNDYCNLTKGNYSIYMKFSIPEEFSGKKLEKNGWSGSIVSNKIDIEVE